MRVCVGVGALSSVCVCVGVGLFGYAHFGFWKMAETKKTESTDHLAAHKRASCFSKPTDGRSKAFRGVSALVKNRRGQLQFSKLNT